MKALITGASSGIGKHFAIELAKHGYDIVITARREEKLKELKQLIEKQMKVKVDYIITDLSKSEDVNKLKDLIKKDKDINYLINNAGVGYFGNTINFDIERARSLIRLNIEALTTLTIAANHAFNGHNNARIMNVSSIVAYTSSMPTNGIYAASKRYVDAFTKSVNYENKKLKIKVRVIALRPGIIATDWAKEATGSRKNDPYAKNKLASDPAKFAKKVIKKSLKRRNVITLGMGGYTFKFFSPILCLFKSFMYRYGNKAEKM